MENSFKTVTSRRKIIDACIEQGITIEDANIKLQSNNFNPITEKDELEWYEKMRQNYLNTSLRKKIIEKGKLQGLSRFEINLVLRKHQLRHLNEYEAQDYEFSLSRKKAVNVNSLGTRTAFKDDKPSKEDIIKNGLKDQKNLIEINNILKQNGYEELTENDFNEQKKEITSSGRNRESIILEGIKNNTRNLELNRILKNNNLAPLSQFEQLDYDQKKHLNIQEKRNYLIKNCVEERLYTDEINDCLKEHNFEILTEIEEKKIIQHYKNTPEQDKENYISPQFQNLYKEAIKKFHPDMYVNETDKFIANRRMKEINEAKSMRDFFKLRNLIEQYINEDLNKKQM